MTLKKILLASVFAFAAAGATGAQAQVKEVEMVHWWTSGGEAAALNVLKDNLQKQG
jgi:glucose/mannose transport system substrate-binding protein